VSKMGLFRFQTSDASPFSPLQAAALPPPGQPFWLLANRFVLDIPSEVFQPLSRAFFFTAPFGPPPPPLQAPSLPSPSPPPRLKSKTWFTDSKYNPFFFRKQATLPPFPAEQSLLTNASLAAPGGHSPFFYFPCQSFCLVPRARISPSFLSLLEAPSYGMFSPSFLGPPLTFFSLRGFGPPAVSPFPELVERATHLFLPEGSFFFLRSFSLVPPSRVPPFTCFLPESFFPWIRFSRSFLLC